MLSVNKSETLWFQKYRPQTVEECILPPAIKEMAIGFVAQKEIPNLLLSGPAGCGKTTLAGALLNELGYDSMFINASKDRGIDAIRNQITEYASSVSLTGGRKFIILDEMDSLSVDAQKALRSAIEAFSSNCGIIGTCNFKNKLLDPILSRFVVIDFTFSHTEKVELMKSTIRRCVEILKSENIEFDVKALSEIVKISFPDMRRIINTLQRYSVHGKIDTGILTSLGDSRLETLIGFLKSKNFKNMRQWAAENNDVDFNIFVEAFYKSCEKYIQPQSLPAIILILNKYDYQNAFVANKELNLISMLTEIMAEGQWK